MISDKRTKIVATIGPNSESEEMLERLIKAGMNVARLNMSHGDHEEHTRRFKNIRAVSERLGVPIPILFDLSGPKIRTGEYSTPTITLKAGQEFVLTVDECMGDETRVHVNYANLVGEVKQGSIIMLDDGKKKLEVVRIQGNDVITRVIVGGEMKPRRGVNVPGAYLSIATITEKDKKDLAFGIELGADYFALSFVRRADDIDELKTMLKDGKANIPVIAKIETLESIENLDDIVSRSDGIMVARGDLAIEVPTEKVPLFQKEMIRKANLLGKPVITATQMLESMIHSPTPTRAEVSDIANAILDGTDAVMLSEESALGEYPVEAVTMMSRVATTVEASLNREPNKKNSVADIISESVHRVALDAKAKLIVVLTRSGTSAQLVSRYRPNCPILAITKHQETVEKLALVRGVYPYLNESPEESHNISTFVPDFLTRHKLAKKGDTVVVVAGLSSGKPKATNMLAVITV